ncbi:hypothetical protein C2S52_015063 [Perilla frutescens var. hirtella]|nr:hypothetical protein C2S52_015063 [Perilla frutescens var. hirtella]
MEFNRYLVPDVISEEDRDRIGFLGLKDVHKSSISSSVNAGEGSELICERGNFSGKNKIEKSGNNSPDFGDLGRNNLQKPTESDRHLKNSEDGFDLNNHVADALNPNLSKLANFPTASHSVMNLSLSQTQ